MGIQRSIAIRVMIQLNETLSLDLDVEDTMELLDSLGIASAEDVIVDPRTGERLRGARVAAGYVAAKAAVERLGVHEATYRHAENGLRNANDDLLASAAELFDVSEAFLLEGKASTPREQLAERLTNAINILESRRKEEDFGTSLRGFDFEWPTRLRRIRIDSGFASAAAAAKANGWSPSTYNAHELGTRRMSIERLIGYCLGMGGRPEHAVDGSMPVLDAQRVDWTEHKTAFEVAAAKPPAP